MIQKILSLDSLTFTSLKVTDTPPHHYFSINFHPLSFCVLSSLYVHLFFCQDFSIIFQSSIFLTLHFALCKQLTHLKLHQRLFSQISASSSSLKTNPHHPVTFLFPLYPLYYCTIYQVILIPKNGHKSDRL